MVRHRYFVDKTKGTFTADALVVPENPLFLRHDCTRAVWCLGDTCYGGVLEFICLKFSHLIATEDFFIEGLGVIREGSPLGQLWLVPVQAGKSPGGQPLPINVIFYTLLRNFQGDSPVALSGSLINFKQKAVLAQSQGYDFRELLWTATFKDKLTVARGKEIWHYVLDFEYAEPDEAALSRLDQTVVVLESEGLMARLYDPVIGAVTWCADDPSARNQRLIES